MIDDKSRVEEMFRGPALEELSIAGLQVEEPLDVENIELTGRMMPGLDSMQGWETAQLAGAPVDVLPDEDLGLNFDADEAGGEAPPSAHERRIEYENLQLAADIAELRAASAERERAFEARIAELAAQLDEREGEIMDQSAQISSLTLERDGLRARLDRSASPPPSWLERDPVREERQVVSLKSRLEERGRALAVAREELEDLRAERGRLAAALAERATQVARLLDELNGREAKRGFNGDFRGALQRLIATARRVPVSDTPAPAPDEDRYFMGAAATETIVIDPPPPPMPEAPAVAPPMTPPADPERTPLRRFLLSMEQGSGEAHELAGERMYVGRAPEAAIRITDTTVSRVHAVLRLDGEQVVVEDAASTNGVYVNGARVRAAVLSDFDTVTFGNVAYLFRLGPAAEESALRGQ